MKVFTQASKMTSSKSCQTNPGSQTTLRKITSAISMRNLSFVFSLIMLLASTVSKGQVLWSSSGGSAWLTGTNWTGGAVPNSTQIAQFGVNPTGASGVGINANTSPNNTVGAVEVTNARAAAFLIGNSSTSAGANLTLTFSGVTVNGIANTVLRNASSQAFTLQNIQGSGNQTSSYILGNATANVVNVDGTGNIVISTVLSGASKNLTFNATSTGDLRLSGANTYSGGTIVNSTGTGRLRIDATNSLPTTGTVRINTAAVMRFNVAGTYGGVGQVLEFNPNQTTTPSLDINFTGTAIWQGNVNFLADTRIEPSGAGNVINFSGSATGSGMLIKQAAGTLTLSGTGNTLTGGTQIGNGILNISSGSSMGTGALLLAQTSTNSTTVNLNNAAQTIGSLSSTWTAVTGTAAQTVNLASGHVLTINQSTNTTFGAGAVATLTSSLAGAGSIVKSGAGTLTLSSANTYTGTTTINGGTIQLGASNIISNSSNFILGGGTFSTGATTGNSETVGTLNLTASTASTIALGTGNHTLTLANSSSLSPWGTGATLTITGWAGTAGASGTAGKIMVGVGGLTSAQLAQISFSGYPGTTATILGTGELVPLLPAPAITVNGAGSATATAFTTTYGTASAAQTFTVAGTNLTTDITATAPTGFEVANDGATYGTTTTFTQSGGNASGTLSVRLTATAQVAGSYNAQNITLSSTGATTINVITAAGGNTVNPMALTVTAAAANNKEYDGTNAATITGTLNGVIGADDVTLNGTGTSAQVTVGTGIAVTSTSTLTGAQSGNYTLTQPTGLSADITAKGLAITGIVANNKTFDGNTTATLSGTATLAGVVPVDAGNLTVGGTVVANFTQSAVGTSIPVTVTGYTLSGSASGNYTLTQPTGLTANITSAPTPVISSALTFSATYGTVAATYTITATNSPTSYNATGLPNGLNVDTFNGQITGTATDGPGDYNVTITATNGGGTSTPATLVYTILQKHLDVLNAIALDKEYDRTNTATIFGDLDGIFGSDDVSLNGSGTFAQSTVGTGIAVTSTSTLTGADASKYSFTQITGLTAAITQKGLIVVSATAANKPYDGNTLTAISSIVLAGVISPDDVSASGNGNFTTAQAGNNIAVTTSLVLGGADAANYSLDQPTGLTANITPKDLTISGVSAVNKIYDGNNIAGLTGTATLNGILGTDDVSPAGTVVANFNNKTVGTTKPVTVTGYILAGADAGNYSVSQPTGLSADITTAPLTISGAAAQNKNFDGNTNAVITGTLSGIISPDVVTLVGTGTFASSAVGTAIAVTSTSTLAGADALNYVINPQPSGLTANIIAVPDTLAKWTYEPLQGATATPTANVGTGSSALVGSMTGPGTATGMNGTGCGAQVTGQNAWAIAAAAPGAANQSSGAQFNTSTVGHYNIRFSWDQRSSNTSANTERLQYTTNGTTWNDFTMTAGNTTFCLGSLNNGRFENNTTGDSYRRISVDLSSITAINNNANFGVRVVAAFYQATGQFRQTQTPASIATAGTWRFDNVYFAADIAPAGSTAAVLSGTATICNNTSTNLQVAITGGVSPYTVVYTDGTNNFTVNNYTTGSDIPVTPTTTTTYSLVSITDAASGIGTGNSGSAVITVNGPYTITVTAGANGSITPGTGSVDCGTNATYTITPNACYSIADVVVDGVSQGAVGTYTFTNVTAAHTISATFVLNTYTITVTAGANGSITPATGSVNCGDNATYTITPNACYSITDVIVDGVSQGAVGTYTFTNVTAAHSISATFILNTYTITVTAGANGLITPATGSVNCGDNATYTITPNSCYSIADVIVDAVSQGAVGTYTFTNVTAAHSISATFVLNTYTITVTAGANGSIAPATGSVNCGDNAAYTITPGGGYSIADVVVDGVSQGSVSTYTFTNVTANHTISASFVANASFTITSSAGVNGSISPNGITVVNSGANQSYTMTPIACYHVADVLVDGVSVGAVTTYTFTNVTANHTISVSFAINAALATPTVTGPVNVCPYLGTGTQVTYTFNSPGATGYSFTIPPTNVTLVSSTVNSITVTFASAFKNNGNKQIRVTALSPCGNSPLLVFVLAAQAPNVPQPITGPTSVCPIIGTAGTFTYTIPSVLGATSYIWLAQLGTTTITHPNGPGVNDTTVNVSFANGFTSSNITVAAANDSCGASNARSLALVKANPSTPGLIAGSTNACPYMAPGGIPATYSVTAVAGQTYNWIVPAGAIGLTGQGTNTISFTYPSSFVSGTISVTTTNGCGTSPTPRTLSINKLNPATPGIIDVIQTQPCPNRVFTYTISATPANSTFVQWTVPVGATLVSGQGSNSITVSYPGTSFNGNVTAQSFNNCGSSTVRSTAVHLPACSEDGRQAAYSRGDKTEPVKTAEAMKVNVYPNPTVSDFKLQVVTAGKQTIYVRITDAQGRNIKTFEVMPYQTINVGSDLNAGTYMMEVRQGDEVKVTKLLKF